MAFKKTDKFCHPLFHPLNPQKWTIDPLFQNNRICKHVTNFKTPALNSPPCGRPNWMISLRKMKGHLWIFWMIKTLINNLRSTCNNLYPCNNSPVRTNVLYSAFQGGFSSEQRHLSGYQLLYYTFSVLDL